MVQNFPFYESTLYLSEDSKEIVIMNKKFKSKKEHVKTQNSYKKYSKEYLDELKK